jgi:biotin operon repressor
MDERALLERELLKRLMAGPATGDSLAQASGQTRAAIWKRIEHLREAGVAIEAKPGRATPWPSRWTCSMPTSCGPPCRSPHGRACPRWKWPGPSTRPTANC